MEETQYSQAPKIQIVVITGFLCGSCWYDGVAVDRYGSGSWPCKSMQWTLLLSPTDELKVLNGQ